MTNNDSPERQKSEDYVHHLQQNKEATAAYYRKSVVKTEQQKFLEGHLKAQGASFGRIADLACGAGTLSYHLSQLFPTADFFLSDLNAEAIALARETCKGGRFHFAVDDLFALDSVPHGTFDAVFCWQTLLLFDSPERFIDSILRLPRPGGKLYLMALFNLERDVDILARIVDHTRAGDRQAGAISYNTFSRLSVGRWLEGKVAGFSIYPFNPASNFEYGGRGLGTSTVETSDHRLQISGGYLMNWGLLEVTK